MKGKKIKDKIRFMQRMRSQDEFDHYYKLFQEEYKKYKEFLKYFTDTYVDGFRNKWHYFNIPSNLPLTNCRA